MRFVVLMVMTLVLAGGAWAEADGVSVPLDELITLSGKQGGWRGLYAGTSRVEDMKRVLGEPASSEVDDGTTRYVYPPGEGLKFNSVYVENGVVKTIGWALFDPKTYVTGRDLWRLFGEPVVLSQVADEPGAAAYRWPTAGVWGVIAKDRGKVHSLVFYPPAQPPKFQLRVEPVQ